jgi:hypothetical protein
MLSAQLSNDFRGSEFVLPRFLPARLRLLWLLLLAFLIFNGLVRLGLVAYNGQWGLFAPWRLLPAMAIGALFDMGVATFFIAPLGLIPVPDCARPCSRCWCHSWY